MTEPFLKWSTVINDNDQLTFIASTLWLEIFWRQDRVHQSHPGDLSPFQIDTGCAGDWSHPTIPDITYHMIPYDNIQYHTRCTEVWLRLITPIPALWGFGVGKGNGKLEGGDKGWFMVIHGAKGWFMDRRQCIHELQGVFYCTHPKPPISVLKRKANHNLSY